MSRTKTDRLTQTIEAWQGALEDLGEEIEQRTRDHLADLLLRRLAGFPLNLIKGNKWKSQARLGGYRGKSGGVPPMPKSGESVGNPE